MGMAVILVAIGANLPGRDGGSPMETCRDAVERLRGLGNPSVTVVSRWYESASLPPSGQPPYVNGVVRMEELSGTEVDPAALLARLQAIEAEFGRVRGAANAARTLDLDIVAMGDLIRRAPDPILPHPRAHLRAFVLAPLRDVAPGWVHPVLGVSAEALLAGLRDQDCRPLLSD
jgi:2-amino-4-hydroxy-6-hydroxymethyldihydropteridine diphosphokinase